MAFELKQGLKLSQQLVMTPQLQQAIKLLQLSRLELENTITAEMLENPILEESDGPSDSDTQEQGMDAASETSESDGGSEDLEVPAREGDDFDWENYMDSYNTGALPPSSAGSASLDELPSYENTVARSQTLTDHLIWQLKMAELDAEMVEHVEELIGNLNEDGYLMQSLEALAEQHGVPAEKFENALYKLQEFDPVGVGARSLKECLLLQAWALKLPDDAVETIIENHLSDLEKKNYPAIAKALGQELEDVIEAIKIIHEMEPKPGRPFASQETQYITPDVYVSKVGDDYVISMNEDGIPRLRISKFYRSMMQAEMQAAKAKRADKTPPQAGAVPNTHAVTKDYIQDKLRSALWLIKSIYQRQRTIYKVTEAIVKRQRDFFDHGVSGLKPMILRDIADDIGMHESTVSRVTTNKYVHTPQGVFELKFFFNTGLSRAAGGGEDVAAESVKQRVKKIISGEDSRRPLSDQEIADLLTKENITAARRTVAKYREQLGILPSSKRKKFF